MERGPRPPLRGGHRGGAGRVAAGRPAAASRQRTARFGRRRRRGVTGGGGGDGRSPPAGRRQYRSGLTPSPPLGQSPGVTGRTHRYEVAPAPGTRPDCHTTAPRRARAGRLCSGARGVSRTPAHGLGTLGGRPHGPGGACSPSGGVRFRPVWSTLVRAGLSHRSSPTAAVRPAAAHSPGGARLEVRPPAVGSRGRSAERSGACRPGGRDPSAAAIPSERRCGR